MKAYIVTNVPLSDDGLAEIKELTNFEIEVLTTKKEIVAKKNPYFNDVWGDFDWLRGQFPLGAEIRCFVTSRDQLKQKGITSHIGMYDMTDKDGVYDFYIGLPTKLGSRAKNNGFKTELARIFCHEWCHGAEQHFMMADRTHTMEDQGRLKELLAENIRKVAQQKKISTLQKMLNDLKDMFKRPTTLHKRLPDPFNNYISQDYGVVNPMYKVTGRHIGVDYACPEGTPIYAVWDGEVTEAGYSKEMGYYCVFRYTFNGETREERNMHLRATPVKGMRKRGWIIGFSGNTGWSTGAHYHVDGWHGQVAIGSINKTNWDFLTYDPKV